MPCYINGTIYTANTNFESKASCEYVGGVWVEPGVTPEFDTVTVKSSQDTTNEAIAASTAVESTTPQLTQADADRLNQAEFAEGGFGFTTLEDWQSKADEDESIITQAAVLKEENTEPVIVIPTTEPDTDDFGNPIATDDFGVPLPYSADAAMREYQLNKSEGFFDTPSNKPITAPVAPEKGGVDNNPSAARLNNFKQPFKAHSFEKDTYGIDQYSFPSDILDESYGGNYTIFYINVSQEGLLDTPEETLNLDPNLDATSRNSVIGRIMTDSTMVGAVAGVNVITAALGQTSGLNAIMTSGGTMAIAAQAPDHLRQNRRLKAAIALHIPNNLAVKYGTTWGTESSAYLDMAARGLQSTDIADVLSSKSKDKMSTSLGASNMIANATLRNSKIGGLSSAFGVAANPKLTQTFQGVEFRTFTFDYTFYPRNEKEADNVMNIIHMFKLHMHPEFKSELDYVWVYPSEFDIVYYTDGEENSKLHRHTTCILENMNVNYTPNGNFSVFANGQPTQINVSLSFRELQLASKETIGKEQGSGL